MHLILIVWNGLKTRFGPKAQAQTLLLIGTVWVLVPCDFISRAFAQAPPRPALDTSVDTAQPRAGVRLIVQETRLAGFMYAQAPLVFTQIQPGDELQLQAEPDNPHDPGAVRVWWRGHPLGYVPKRHNRSLAWALLRGERLRAQVTQVQMHPNPAMRLWFEVFIE